MERMKKAEWDARIGACAIMLRADRPAKVAAIAQSAGIDEDSAARRYVVGALKASVLRGTAQNYSDALDRYERAQVGDNHTAPHAESPIVAEVRRINVANETHKARSSRSHRPNMGRVLGELYVGWSAQAAALAPEAMSEDWAADVIARYIEEYIGRLSRTMRGTIRDIVHSRYDDAAIMKGKTPKTEKWRQAIKYMHRNFPHAEDVTARELLGLVRKYAKVA